MSEFEQNMPDDFWRKAFEDAAESPPPRVWDAVEHRLDEDGGPKILPLWGNGLASSRPLAWAGIAAAITLLLVGWWTLQKVPSENPVARRQSPGRAERVAVTPSAPDKLPTNASPKLLPRPSTVDEAASDVVASTQKSTVRHQNQEVPIPVQPTDRRIRESPAPIPSDPLAATPKRAGEQQTIDAQPIRLARRYAAPAVRVDNVPLNDRVTPAENMTAPMTANALVPTAEPSLASTLPTAAGQTLFFDPIRPSALRLREPGGIQRIVWFRPAETATEPTAVQPKREREVWASVSLMPGAFDPAVAVRTTQPTFARADPFTNTSALTNSNSSQPSINSRANFSVAYQAGAGVQLTERWSVESGVGYLAGRSTVGSPVQTPVLSYQSAVGKGQEGNLYVDALRSRSVSASSVNGPPNNSSMASFDASAYNRFAVQNSYNPQNRKFLTNDYQFVQVPVQVGYQLRPRKRLSLALLGGFLSNIFVRNTVGNELVVTTRDGIYRPVSWAATLGARFRYRPSRQWSASLAGLYQPSLGAGTRPESIVQTRPTSTGLSFGIDYHF